MAELARDAVHRNMRIAVACDPDQSPLDEYFGPCPSGRQVFDKPKLVGQSEYTAIYGLLEDLIEQGSQEQLPLAEIAEQIVASLDEFEAWAGELKARFASIGYS